MVSKSEGPGRGLVCSQCSYPMDAELRRERPGWNWRDLSSLVLIGVFTASALLITGMGELVLRRALPPDRPARDAGAIGR